MNGKTFHDKNVLNVNHPKRQDAVRGGYISCRQQFAEQPAPITKTMMDRDGIEGLSGLLPLLPGRCSADFLRNLQTSHGNRFVQRMLALNEKADGNPEVSDEVENAIQGAKGTGHALDSTIRAGMERALGSDFVDVKVHTGAKADTLGRALNARAFTSGRDIFFRDGEYNTGSSHGKELLAHELTHVMQQAGGIHGKLTVSRPDDEYEREADKIGRAVALSLDSMPSCADNREDEGKGKGTAVYQEEDEGPQASGSENENSGKESYASVGRGRTHGIQRELATPEPALGPMAQPDLNAAQIRQAILYNEGRYDAANTRRIQDIIGVEQTGRWDEASVRAVASIQEEYRYKKDGMVGPEFFRFLSEELRAEGAATTTPNVLVMFATPGNVTAAYTRQPGGMHRLAGFFSVNAQFEERANCSQWEYRQFIRGTCTRTRGGVAADLKRAFSFLPQGELKTTFQEDGDTSDTVVNYGHRSNPADTDPLDRYRTPAGATDQRNGSRYECNDRPNIETPAIAGDTIDLNLQFRGEIQRNGATVESKLWNVSGRQTVT